MNEIITTYHTNWSRTTIEGTEDGTDLSVFIPFSIMINTDFPTLCEAVCGSVKSKLLSALIETKTGKEA